jgi:hypothetical protein
MADRYWVGGAGTWDATTTTNWSATSGGAGGSSAPTSVDNVFFNSLSNATAYAVTIGTNAVAQDITIAGPLVGNVTITMGATAVINCFSNWNNAASGVVFTTTSGAAINFSAPTTGKIFITNNVAITNTNIVFTTTSGGWTLGTAITCNGVFVNAGTFNTGNFAMTINSIQRSGSAVASVSLGSSAIACSGTTPVNLLATNLTLSAGTSTITCTTVSPTFTGGAQTFYNVTFSSTATGTTTINGANTFNVLTQAAIAAAGLRFVTLGANQTIATLTLSAGASAVTRTFVRSDAIGTQRTLTVGTLTAISDVDFRDIVAAGASAASPWTGTRLGDCKNNSNITFTAAATKYWSTVNGASANWSNVNAWATSSGGVPAVANFPLAQDTCIIDDSGATTGNGLRTGNTVTIDALWNMGTLNFSGRTVAFNWTQGNSDPVIYGDVTLTSAMTMVTVTGTPSWTFANQGTVQALNSAGITLRLQNLIINSPGGGVSLTANTAVDLSPIVAPNVTGTVTLTAGTLNLSNNVLTTVLFAAGASANTLAFGTGNITLTGTGTIFTGSTTTTATGTPLVICTDNSATARTITPGVVTEANSISFRITAGTGNFTITNNQVVKDLDFTDGTNPTGFAGNLANTTLTVYGNFKASTGMTRTAGTGVYTFAATSGTKTINTAGVTFDNPFTFNGVGGTWRLLSDVVVGPSPAGVDSTRATTLTAGTLDVNGFTLTTGTFSGTGSVVRRLVTNSVPIVVTGSGATVVNFGTTGSYTVDVTPTFNLTYSGAVGTRAIAVGAPFGTYVNAPNINVAAAGDIVTTSGTTTLGSLTFASGFTGTFGNATRNINGNLTLVSGMVVASGTLTNTFVGTSSQTITTAGQTLDFPITFNGIGGTWTLQDDLTVGSTRTLLLLAGTFTTNGYAVSCGKFGTSAANGDRTLNLGSSSFTCFGSTTTSASWQVADSGFSYTLNAGTSTIYLAEPFTGLSQQYFYGGGKTYNNVVFSTTQPGGFYDSSTFNSISNSAQPLTLGFEAGSTQTVNNFNVSGTAGNLVTLQSETPGTQWNLVKATGSKVVVSFCSITDSNVTPTPGYWFAPTSQGNVDGGNNTGWNFGSAGDNSSFMLLM